MLRTSILVCYISTVLGIIVTDPPPSKTDYRYSYDIEDPNTGDSKSQHEVRRGDVVNGAYSVLGPDGNKRTVEYTADPLHGYKAILREEPVQKQQTPHPYFLASRVQNPVYTLRAKLPDLYAKDANIVLFTPVNENEIQSDRLALEHGKYFEPATK